MTYDTQQTTIAFTGGPLDHAEDRRDLTSIKRFLEQKDCQAILLQKGRVAAQMDGSLTRVHPSALTGQNIYQPAPVMLGLDGQTPIFAFHLTDNQDLADPNSFISLRDLASYAPPAELALAGRARSLFNWHDSHRFCANCGAESQAAGAGMFRKCQACQTEHFPRVNPIAIMLVLHQERCLLASNVNFPVANAFSALAGYVSPGESLEEACQREVKEECGLDIHSVQYVFSQPWPFPSQLMMGLTCTTDNPDRLKVNPKEISGARWFTRADISDILAQKRDDIVLPPKFTIARQLINQWLESA